jgi:hypothetical protein
MLFVGKLKFCLVGFIFNFFHVGNFCLILYMQVGRDSSVDIATRYGLCGSGDRIAVKRKFPHLSRPALGTTQPPIQRIPRPFLGGKAAGA